MASTASQVAFLVEQLGAGACAKPMFGEYGIYRHDVFIGVVCDNRLFLKATHAVRMLLPRVEEAPPYRGAKPAFVVPPDILDDRDVMSQLAQATAEELQAGAKGATSPKRARGPARAVKRAGTRRRTRQR